MSLPFADNSQIFSRWLSKFYISAKFPGKWNTLSPHVRFSSACASENEGTQASFNCIASLSARHEVRHPRSLYLNSYILAEYLVSIPRAISYAGASVSPLLVRLAAPFRARSAVGKFWSAFPPLLSVVSFRRKWPGKKVFGSTNNRRSGW